MKVWLIKFVYGKAHQLNQIKDSMNISNNCPHLVS